MMLARWFVIRLKTKYFCTVLNIGRSTSFMKTLYFFNFHFVSVSLHFFGDRCFYSILFIVKYFLDLVGAFVGTHNEHAVGTFCTTRRQYSAGPNRFTANPIARKYSHYKGHEKNTRAAAWRWQPWQWPWCLLQAELDIHTCQLFRIFRKM